MPNDTAVSDWMADEHGIPELRDPRTILDLVNYQMHQIEAVNASHVTRICEGEFGITRREWRFIALMAALGPMAPSELAQRAGLDRSRTSKALTALLAKKLVARRVRPEDNRRATMTLTTEGERLYARIFPHVRRINTELLAALDDDEVRLLAQVLNRLRRRAVEIVRDGPVSAQADRRRGGSRRAWESSARK